MGSDDITNQIETEEDLEEVLRQYRERLETAIELSSGFYWEEDEHYRLTFYWHQEVGRSDTEGDPLGLLGRHASELGELPPSEQGRWLAHMAVRDARQPFYDFVRAYIHPETGEHRYTRISGKPTFDSEDNFKGYRGIAQDVTQEIHAEQMLQLETSVLRFISDKENVADAVRGAMQMICESLGWEAGSFWLLDEQSGVLRYKTGWSSEKNPVVAQIMERAGDVFFERGSGLPGWVWETGESLWIPDIMNDSRVWTKEVTELTGWNAAFLFPVTLEGKFLGVLDFYAPEILKPSGRLLQIIRMLGIEIGHYYQRALIMEQQRASEARFRSLTELPSDWYWEQDIEFRFTLFEGRDKSMIDYMRREYIGKRSWDIDVENANVENTARNTLKVYMENHESFRDVILYRRISEGDERYVSVSGEPLYDYNGNFTGYRGITRDVTETKHAEEKIQYLATHDHLTGLPNRNMFSQFLNHSIETGRRYGRRFAVLFLDLDGFKAVNDTLGHYAGDKLLIEAATRLKDCLRESDVVARMGGDEFVILVQEVNERAQIDKIAGNVLSVASKPFMIQEQECRVTASVGICRYPEDAQDEETILKYADTAMYMAKQKGKNNYQFYYHL